MTVFAFPLAQATHRVDATLESPMDPRVCLTLASGVKSGRDHACEA